ncbi:MAG: hypothetical protein FRX49_05156 [Trebouxia sp. A1-2]|nr:MAG: hypothetical protein FRX49_05156 [Trebouxia sp. A1-2]
MRLLCLELVLSAFYVVLASAQLPANFPLAPAPGPEVLNLAAAGLPANQVRAGPVNLVSTPFLTALVPIAGDIRADVTTGVKQVESGIDEAKGDWPAIEASFTGRKLLAVTMQEARGKRIRAASVDGKPSLKRLQAKLEEKVQAESALAAASAAALGQTDATVTSNDTVTEDEDARIERELAQMKEDRLKAIQALPRSVWS